MSDLTSNPVSSAQFGIINFVGCSSSSKTFEVSAKEFDDLASKTKEKYGFFIENYFKVGHISGDQDVEYEFNVAVIVAVIDKSIKDIKLVHLYKEHGIRLDWTTRDLYAKDREEANKDQRNFFFMVPDVIRESWGKQIVELEIEYTNGKKQNIRLIWKKPKIEVDNSAREEMRPWKTP